MDNNLKLKQDLQQAIKDQNTLRKRVLRLLISSIQLAEIAKGSQLNDSEFIAVFRRKLKQNWIPSRTRKKPGARRWLLNRARKSKSWKPISLNN